MRPTRLGLGAAAMAALTLMAAASTGNNLLYLLYSAATASLILSALAGRLNLRSLRAAVEPGTQAFAGGEFPLTLRVENRGSWTSYGVRVAWGSRSRELGTLGPGARASARLTCAAPHRGRNALEGLALESLFPFGLLRHRARIDGAVVLALPRTSPARSAAELTADARSSGKPEVRRGRGEELFGVRAYDPSDDSRTINWKLSARTGRLLVNEYCEAGPSHVTVRAAGGRGPAAERAIDAAAAACRFYSDAGAAVELVTPRERIGPARGLRHLDRMLEALALLGEGEAPRPSPPPAELPAAAPEDPALRRLTFLGIVLAFTSMFLVDEINPRTLLMLSPLLGAGLWVQKRGRSPLPERVWRALSLGALAFTVLVDWRLSGVTVANSHLLLYLLANRALHPLGYRDLPQTFLIQYLAFFLASGLTISLWYFVFFLAYLGYAAAWLLAAARARPDGVRARAGALGALCGAGLVLCALSFVATPRVEGLRRINPFLAAGIDKLAVTPASVTGYTDNVTLGYYGLLKKSSARVMQLRPLGEGADRPRSLYVRGAAYDLFEGARWRRTSGRFTFALQGRRYPSRDGRAYGVRKGPDILFPARLSGETESFDVTVYPMALSTVFVVGTPWKIETEQAVTFDHTASLAFAAPYNVRGAHYKTHGKRDSGGLSLELAPEQHRAALAPLSKDPRVAALAARATRGAKGELAKISAVESFLRRSFRYTLFGEGAGRSLEDFLFKSKRGNCEYFATAGVALLRASGVPARLATGFLVSDWNEYGRFYDVRQSEAHAWVEAYVAGRGWVTVDPTPPQDVFSQAFDDFGHKLARWADAVQVEWYRHIIGYDQYVQGNTFRRLSVALSPRALAGAASAGARALGLFAAVALLAGAWRAWRRHAARRPPGLWQRVEPALEKLGFSRPAHLTPREFARELSARPGLSELPVLAELHYAQAYAGRALSREEEAEASRILKSLSSK